MLFFVAQQIILKSVTSIANDWLRATPGQAASNDDALLFSNEIVCGGVLKLLLDYLPIESVSRRLHAKI